MSRRKKRFCYRGIFPSADKLVQAVEYKLLPEISRNSVNVFERVYYGTEVGGRRERFFCFSVFFLRLLCRALSQRFVPLQVGLEGGCQTLILFPIGKFKGTARSNHGFRVAAVFGIHGREHLQNCGLRGG